MNKFLVMFLVVIVAILLVAWLPVGEGRESQHKATIEAPQRTAIDPYPAPAPTAELVAYPESEPEDEQNEPDWFKQYSASHYYNG